MQDATPVDTSWLQEPAPPSTSPIDIVSAVLRLARRQILVVLLIGALATLVGGAYAWTTPPVYTAEASIMVETRKVQVFSGPPMLDDGAVDGAAIESQIQLLRSDRIAEAVVDQLQLMQIPEFVEPPPGLLLRLRRLINQLRPGTFPAEPAMVATPEDVRRAARQSVQDRLEVYRLGASFAIAIRFRASDPVLAARVANATAEAFIAEQRQAKTDATTGASAWMRDRLHELREQSATADDAVTQYKLNNKIVVAKGQRLDDQKLTDLNTQLGTAREQTAAAQAKFDRIQAVIAADTHDPGQGATVSDALTNSLITNLRARYLELSTRLSDWSVRFGANHLAVVDLRRQLEDVRRSTLNELKRLAETHRSDFEIAKKKEANLERQLQDAIAESQSINAAQSTLKELESTAQIYRTLYDSLLQRYSESAQQQSFPLGDAQLLNSATPPSSKSKPKTKLILAGSCLAGLLLGLGAGFLREMFERVFRTGDQVEDTLRTECIAMVPAVSVSRWARRRRSGARRGSVLKAFPVTDGQFSESIRAIKSSLDHNRRARTQVIGLTSAVPNEGKSATVLELALLAAQVGSKVVIVDCDLRSPSISRRLAGEAERDLIDVVSGRCSLEDALWTDPDTGVTVLPGCFGRLPMHSGEILALPETASLFDRLRSSYDYVIVDLPPLLALVDVRASSTFVDAFGLVIAWGQTRVDVVEHALKSVRAVRDNLLGVILTMVDARRLRTYEGHRRSYPDHVGRLDADAVFIGVRRQKLEGEPARTNGFAVSAQTAGSVPFLQP